MVIDLVDGNIRQQALLVRRLIEKWIFSNELIRLESRIKALPDNRQDFLKTYDEYFNQAQLVPFDRVVFEKATDGCTEFWTNDLHLSNAASGQLNVVDWAELQTK